MRRREFITLFGSGAVSSLRWMGAPRAEGGRVYRIGVLETVPLAQNGANFDALRRGLREHGYVEGKNLEIAYRSAEGQSDRFPHLAAELVRLDVDLILTRGTPAAQAAKVATGTIPVVMAAIGEPLGAGVVESLAHPGGNVTGLSAFVAELAAKRIELLKEAFPSIARVGSLQNMGNPVSPPQWEATLAAAKDLGISAELLDVRSDGDIAGAFAIIAAHKVDALSVGIDALTQMKAAVIVTLAAGLRLPTVYPAREFVDIGGMLSYGVSYPDLYYRAASLINKIFNGAKPGDLPVEQPTKLELVISLKTAKSLDLDVPAMLIARADEVIE